VQQTKASSERAGIIARYRVGLAGFFQISIEEPGCATAQPATACGDLRCDRSALARHVHQSAMGLG
jgi:hypothetical protein